MPLRHPFQKLCIVSPSDDDHEIILAASGPTINCISLSDGTLIYRWPLQHDTSDDEDEYSRNGNRPSKRRRLDGDARTPGSRQQSEASDESLEIVSERKKGERKKSKFITDAKLPNVSHLLATSDGKYILAVTAEDKTIRVFEFTSNRKLRELSQRSLPKKLCALQLTKDETTILAADKFGDIYALPLHPSEEWAPKEKNKNSKDYKPAATELTVHTKGNLEALRQQQEQKQRSARKEGPDFEHSLVLGHVSLLTDLTVAEGVVDGKPRPFILTADRDEHIRVSRGLPQAHIIETFCLGHREFVTKLCIPPTRKELLIAGNGEPTLRIYEWQTGVPKYSVQICAKINAHMQLNSDLHLPEGRTCEKLAVSGIWPVHFSTTTDEHGTEQSLILVAIEGMPFLLSYVLSSDGIWDSDTIKLRGNALDVAVLDNARQIIVSIDNVHKSFSMKSYRDAHEVQDDFFQIFELHTKEKQANLNNKFTWKITNPAFDTTEILHSLPQVPNVCADEENRGKNYEKVFSDLGEFLYGLENLRKKRDVTAVDEAIEDNAAGKDPELEQSL